MTAPKKCSGYVLRAGDHWVRTCECHKGQRAVSFRSDAFGRPILRDVS